MDYSDFAASSPPNKRNRIKHCPLWCCCFNVCEFKRSSIVVRRSGGGAEAFLPHHEGAVGVGPAQATGPADVMGATGRTPALGLVTRAPLSFALKLYPNTCCHGDALDCKHLSRPQGQKKKRLHVHTLTGFL